MLVFGIISCGFVFAQSLSLSHSARQAARAGVIEGTTCSQIASLAQDSADTVGMDGSETLVAIRRGTSAASASPVCASGGTDQPCQTQPTGTNVYVSLVYDTEAIAPLVPARSR
jgi:Flp pilus assembly protein TadG